MSSNQFEYTPVERKKAPKSFKTCGISNSLDGTKGYALYTEESLEIDDDEEDNEFETESKGESDGEYIVYHLKHL